MMNHVICRGLYYYKSDFEEELIARPIPEDHFYIEIITSGNVHFGKGLERHQYGPGTIFWHEQGDWTIGELGEAGRYSALALMGKYRDGGSRRPAQITSWHDLGELELFAAVCMRDLFDDNIDNDQLAEYMVSRCYYEAYCDLHRKRNRTFPLPLIKAMEILNQYDSYTLSVKDLARLCHVSESYLFMLFRDHLHISPHQYILNRRFKHAKYLLAGTAMPIKSITRECGFASLEHFYRAFKGAFGTSPVKFRQNHSVFPQNLCPPNYVDELG